MSLFFRDKSFYLLNIFGITGCGISLAPSLIDFSSRSWKALRRKYYYPRFVLGSDESGRELSVEATQLINSSGGDKDSVSFSDIVMNWGYYRLQAYDFLISCEKNEYYVARHVWDNWYRLENGKKLILTKEICGGKDKDGAKPIKLDFKKQSGSGQLSKLQIMANSCSFKKNGSGFDEKEKWNWNMECKGDKENNGTECVTLSINKSNYKLEYKREKKNSGR
ncbi:hypothetical protein DNK47_02200 [Mycoplasma wenyonii]|uniref:Lipoprotein n=1 Tax=Mycoplasma wenyonii TaxID=65123 RepID=A0A328PV45_9MOLU|nr:hypothetical protein [Mycoplasma wenyonii]RAO94969.1 hypothetical protein DNK47_02200 [Mycoplasma wenyonii]